MRRLWVILFYFYIENHKYIYFLKKHSLSKVIHQTKVKVMRRIFLRISISYKQWKEGTEMLFGSHNHGILHLAPIGFCCMVAPLILLFFPFLKFGPMQAMQLPLNCWWNQKKKKKKKKWSRSTCASGFPCWNWREFVTNELRTWDIISNFGKNNSSVSG